MALDTYTNLQSAIADWLNRSDLTSQIVDFISLAEGKMTILFALKSDENEATLSTVTGSRYVSLPWDYDLPIGLWYTLWSPRREILYRPVEQLGYSNVSTYPSFWGVDNGKIAFDCNASGVYQLLFRYRSQKSLSVSNQSNWILDNYPQVYLYGALAQAAVFLPGEDRLQTFQGLFDEAMILVQTHEGQHDQMAILRTDYPISRRGINTAANFYSGV